MLVAGESALVVGRTLGLFCGSALHLTIGIEDRTSPVPVTCDAYGNAPPKHIHQSQSADCGKDHNVVERNGELLLILGNMCSSSSISIVVTQNMLRLWVWSSLVRIQQKMLTALVYDDLHDQTSSASTCPTCGRKTKDWSFLSP